MPRMTESNGRPDGVWLQSIVQEYESQIVRYAARLLGDGEHARPYLAAGIGATHFNVKTEGFGSDTFFSFSVGPGVQLMPHSRIGIRIEARAYGTLVQSDTALFCVSDPGGGTAGCAIAVSGAVLWQFQASLGVIFRF